ncbi:MAG TPA: hypothetical protein PLP33_29195 [Leptospiraceae bacterium]|nr:hypothetical protein [Leptospiraceae bacterium]
MQETKTNLTRFKALWVLSVMVGGGCILCGVANFGIFEGFFSRFLLTGMGILNIGGSIYFAVASQKATPRTAKFAQILAAADLMAIGIAVVFHTAAARNVELYSAQFNRNAQVRQQNANNTNNTLKIFSEFSNNQRKLVQSATNRERTLIRSGYKIKPMNIDASAQGLDSLIKTTTGNQEKIVDLTELANEQVWLMKWIFLVQIIGFTILYGGGGILHAFVWEKDENQDGVKDKDEDEEEGEETINP